MVSSYILLVCIILLLIKFVARKAGLRKINQVLGKIHKPLGILAIVIVVVHFVMTLSLWNTRAVLVTISGILTAIGLILMVVLYFFRHHFSNNRMKIHRIGACVILILAAAHVVTYFVDFSSYQERIQSITVTGMDAAGKADGTYTGSCDVGYISARVTVEVKDEKIDKITLDEHHNERGKKAESLIKHVIQTQRTNVDTITGATNSSKVIEKAIENALSK